MDGQEQIALLRRTLSERVNETLSRWRCEYLQHCTTASAVQPAAARYLTFTFGGESAVPCCPGFMHIGRCFAALIFLAQRLGRVAVLPPPWLLLHPSHNGMQPIEEDVNWDRYFDLSQLVAAGIVADPSLRLHAYPAAATCHRERHGRPVSSCATTWGAVTNSSVVPPHTPWRALLASPERVVTLELRRGWGDPQDPRPATDCMRVSADRQQRSALGGGGYCTAAYVSRLASSLAPSRKVVTAAARLVRRLGGGRTLSVVHVRRGRSKSFSAGGQYAGIPGPSVVRATSPEGLEHFFARLPPASPLASPNATVLLMTNEDRPEYFTEVRQRMPGRTLVFEHEMWAAFTARLGVHQREAWKRDNFLRFQALRLVGFLAAERVATARCYFYLSFAAEHGCAHHVVS